MPASETTPSPLDEPPGLMAAFAIGGPEAGVSDEDSCSGEAVASAADATDCGSSAAGACFSSLGTTARLNREQRRCKHLMPEFGEKEELAVARASPASLG
jgi:hypothetical protein